MDIETAWYEFSPYVYIAAGGAAIYFAEEPMARLPGLLLVAAALTIIRLRWSYRRAEEAKIVRASELAQAREELADRSKS